jgi:hypothetical protein
MNMANNNFTVRKGQCVNFRHCSKADSHEVIEVNLGDDFICPNPECEGSLIDLPQKRKFPWWIVIVIVGVLAIGAGVYFSVPFNKNKKVIGQSEDPTVATVGEIGHATAVVAGKAEITAYTDNEFDVTVNKKIPLPPEEKAYSFGKYKGRLKNGIPEGDGKMTYNKRVQIAKHDTEHPPHYAENGDYFVGSWGNGDIASGYLYDRNGNVKERILAPKRFNPYDINKD